MSDSADQHREKLDSAHARMEEIHQLHADLAERTNRLASDHTLMTDTLTQYGAHIDTMADHREQHASLPDRITFLEQAIRDSADKHAAEVEALHQKLEAEQ